MSFSQSSRSRTQSKKAFTLVELLVVIGIIAVLISILLPSLNAARRSAQAVKCMSNLKQIFVASEFYANDSASAYPMSQMQIAAGSVYNLNGQNFPVSGTPPYWINFLARYVTKTKLGTTSTTNDEAAQAHNTILWGCPSWAGYTSSALGGLNRVQTGYGMNMWGAAYKGYPVAPQNFPLESERHFITNWAPGRTGMVFGTTGTANTATQFGGNWLKRKQFGRNGAEKAYIGDSRFWLLESNPAPLDGSIPAQPNINNSVTYTPGIPGQTTADIYRHGKYPGAGTVAGTLSPQGGKITYNMSFCDGHAETLVQARDAYLYTRMKYPG